MAQPASPNHHYTYAEYLAYERDSLLKHEYVNGCIVAMASGSRRKIRVLATGRATYPDASMVCGPIEGDPVDPSGATITNPTLIVEVLSPSTEEDDRGDKWKDYQLLPSLKEYVLVSQSEARIERYRRLDSGAWEYTDVKKGSLELTTGAVLELARLYDDLPA